MKALVVFCLFSVTCYSQSLNYEIYQFSFEDTAHNERLFIDTISNPDNSWQIGPPQKNVFSEAYLSTNAIITDTINPYPINDTSVFTVIHKVNLALSDEQIMALSGYYKVDSDSLKDFGLIEYSPDNGITWLDMINDESFEWSSDKPVLTGSSDWSYFYVSFDDLGYDLRFGDTVRFRFTFISDSIQNNRDGLMYDNLDFEDFYEGIDSRFQNEFHSMVFPNPADKWITIEFDNNDLSSFHLEIIDVSGRLVLKEHGGEQGSFKIDISAFQPGSCLYRLVDRSSNRTSHGKFIVK